MSEEVCLQRCMKSFIFHNILHYIKSPATGRVRHLEETEKQLGKMRIIHNACIIIYDDFCCFFIGRCRPDNNRCRSVFAFQDGSTQANTHHHWYFGVNPSKRSAKSHPQKTQPKLNPVLVFFVPLVIKYFTMAIFL